MKPTPNDHKLSRLHLLFHMISQNIDWFFCSFREFWEIVVKTWNSAKKNMKNIIYRQNFTILRQLGQTNFYFSINLTEFCVQESLDFHVRTAATLKKTWDIYPLKGLIYDYFVVIQGVRKTRHFFLCLLWAN